MVDESEPVLTEAEVLHDVHSELRGAADDLRRLTERLKEQTAVVERLDTLLTKALELIPAAAIVVDADGNLVAASRGARDAYPKMANGALGQPVTTVLPEDLCRDIMAIARSDSTDSSDSSTRVDLGRRLDSGDAPSWVPVGEGEVAALPKGWAIAVLRT